MFFRPGSKGTTGEPGISLLDTCVDICIQTLAGHSDHIGKLLLSLAVRLVDGWDGAWLRRCVSARRFMQHNQSVLLWTTTNLVPETECFHMAGQQMETFSVPAKKIHYHTLNMHSRANPYSFERKQIKLLSLQDEFYVKIKVSLAMTLNWMAAKALNNDARRQSHVATDQPMGSSSDQWRLHLKCNLLWLQLFNHDIAL